ncbi:glycosyltransferase family 4 protein [Agromyces sp. MMS24-K17]|uniref:glycosyltransferase family 4 protein n=1 Tax=Agromyces sp. MMS24-K17 TaxID=3372850 RepID=UPI003754D94C
MQVIFDKRWNGPHGIGRYSREVLRRLAIPHESLKLRSRAGSPRDLLTARPGGSKRLVYSPGYNAGPGGYQLVTVHDLIHLRHGSVKHRLYYERVLRPAIHRIGRVVTVSETSRLEIEEWLADPSVVVHNAGNGCSIEFRPIATSRLPDTILYVGNLKPHKNVDVVLRALKLASDVRLVTVTPDPSAMRRLAEMHAVGRRVTCESMLSDAELARRYNSVAATVVPSVVEGFGLPAVESLACATPVVYWAGCTSVAEIVGRDGIAVDDSQDAEGWAVAFRAACSASVAVRAPATARYDWNTVAGGVGEAIRQAQRDVQRWSGIE